MITNCGQSELCNICHNSFVQIRKVVSMETSEKYTFKKYLSVNWVFSQTVPSVLSALYVSQDVHCTWPLCVVMGAGRAVYF